MALEFENGNYILIYKGHLENKTDIKNIGVFGDIQIYMGKITDMFRRLKFRLPVNLQF